MHDEASDVTKDRGSKIWRRWLGIAEGQGISLTLATIRVCIRQSTYTARHTTIDTWLKRGENDY